MKHTIGGMVFSAGLFLVLLIWSPPALAFQHTMTCTESGPDACSGGEKPKALHWSARCVRYQINENALNNVTTTSKEIGDLAEIRRAVTLSFAAWNDVACSDMTLVDGGLTSADHTASNTAHGDRKTNLVMWRSKDWEKVATARAFALTSVTFNPKNGVIANANIEVNTELYTYSVSDIPLPNHVDLRNTMTHEVGHFVGMDHSSNTAATMFSTAAVGEVAKRSLHPDDIAGLCALYPIGEPSESQCMRRSDFPSKEDLNLNSATCSTLSPGGPPPAGLALLILGLSWGLIRRRRHKSEPADQTGTRRL